MAAKRRDTRASFHELSLARAFLVALLIEALLAAGMTAYFLAPTAPPEARPAPLVVTLEDLPRVAGRTRKQAVKSAPVVGPRLERETPRHRGGGPRTTLRPVPKQSPVVPPKHASAPAPRPRAERESARHRGGGPRTTLNPASKQRPVVHRERASAPASRSNQDAEFLHKRTPPATTTEVAPQPRHPPRGSPRAIPAAKEKQRPIDSLPEPHPTNPPEMSSTQAPAPRMTDAFRAAVRGAIQRAVRYPPAAQIMAEEGAVEVAFDYRVGRSENVHITHSSDSTLLDEAALRTVRSTRLPRAPEGLRRQVLHFRIWIRFRLQDSD